MNVGVKSPSEPGLAKGRNAAYALEGRRQNDPIMEEEEGFLDRTPQPFLYAAVGAFLALGSPLIAFLLRFWLADPLLKWLWIRSELSYNSLFYLYMGVSTALILGLAGYLLGRRSESQRAHNKELRRRARELHLRSVTDGLTGAYSHAYLRETLSIELNRAKRHQCTLSVLILDLDDFKRVNDTHGHLFGDQVLKEITETVNMNIRQEDVLGRYGGEEFLVIMPGADEGIAFAVAERVRKAVARAAIIDVRDKDRVRMTLSIGAATYPGEGASSPDALLSRADANLYTAKRRGKNRVCR